jgi:CRISPR/Cas system-associated exonuclease Cas4 (RecB family)
VTVLDPLEWERAFVRSLGALPLERSAGAARWLLDPAGSSRAVWLRTALSRRRSRSDGRPAGPHDGLWARTDRARRELGRRGLLGRAFTASALEQYARCPYRFFLRAFVGLAPRARALPTSTLAPGAYAALVHRAVFELVGQLREHGVRLDDRDNFRPVEELARSCCRRVVEAALGELMISSDDRRSPMADPGAGASLAAELEADVLGWVRDRSMLRDGFTSIEAGRALGGVGFPSTNPSRSPRIEGRFAIAGIIDLVERHEGGLVRVTDLRADSPPQSHDSARLVAGGERLAPALHLLAMEDAGELGASEAVVEHRTVHATRAGSYARRTLERDERTRPTVLGVLDRIDEAVRSGVLLARPRSGACESCELRLVCGTAELERRGHLESTDETVQHCWKALDALRSTP